MYVRARVYDSLLQQELPLGGDLFVLVKVFWLQCSFACLSLVLSTVLAYTSLFVQYVFLHLFLSKAERQVTASEVKFS